MGTRAEAFDLLDPDTEKPPQKNRENRQDLFLERRGLSEWLGYKTRVPQEPKNKLCL